MPPLIALLPTIAAIGGLAATGTTIGMDIAGAGGSKPAAPTTSTPAPPNAQQLAQQKALISQQVPNIDSATSGTTSPEYQSMIAQILAGVTGQPGANASGAAATGQQFSAANSQPTNAAVNGQDVNLSSFLNNNT